MMLAVILIAVAWGAVSLSKPITAENASRTALATAISGNLPRASFLAQQAERMAPNSQEVNRNCARVWDFIIPGQTVELWERVNSFPSSSIDDRRSLFRAYLAAGEIQKARGALVALTKESPDAPETTYLTIRYLMAICHYPEAAAKARALVLKTPGDRVAWDLYLAASVSQGEEARQRLMQDLEMLKDDRGPLGLWGMQKLCELCPVSELEKRVVSFVSHPFATKSTFLEACVIRHRRANWSYEEIRPRVEAIFNKTLDTDVTQLASFYYSIGDYTDALNLLPPDQAVRNRVCLNVYMQSLLAAKHYDTMLDILNVPQLPLNDCQRELLRFRAYKGLGKAVEAGSSWQKILAYADKGENSNDILFTLSQEPDDYDRFCAVMSHVLKGSPKMMHPLYYRLWLREAYKTRDAGRISEVLQPMAELLQENELIRQKAVYYSILANKPGDWVKNSYDLAKESPGNIANRVTLALALFKKGDTVRAFEIVRATPVADWSVEDVGWQCVRAAIFKANGKTPPTIANIDKALKAERGLVE
jgi:tetratricopeptide (TPR) repeat protein